MMLYETERCEDRLASIAQQRDLRPEKSREHLRSLDWIGADRNRIDAGAAKIAGTCGQFRELEPRERAIVSAIDVNQSCARIGGRRSSANRAVLIDEREAWESLSDRELQRVGRIQLPAHRIADESAAARSNDDACQECEQTKSEFGVRRIESQREPQSCNREHNRSRRERERGPRNSFMNAQPRHRPERHQHIFIEREAARDQDDRADRPDWLKGRNNPGLVVQLRRARVVHARIARFRDGHQLSICSIIGLNQKCSGSCSRRLSRSSCKVRWWMSNLVCSRWHISASTRSRSASAATTACAESAICRVVRHHT